MANGGDIDKREIFPLSLSLLLLKQRTEIFENFGFSDSKLGYFKTKNNRYFSKYSEQCL